MLGFNYDIHLESWKQKLNGYRIYANGDKEQLDGGLGIGLDLLQTCEDGQAWFDTIPSDYLAATALFPEYQYQMLWLSVNCPRAEQLLMCRPLLLALICEQYSVDNEMALSVVQKGQREILAHLGFDDSKAALKFIDKLDMSFEYSNEFAHIQKQLDAAFSRFKLFKHYDRVTYSALVVDHCYPFLTGTRFGKAIAQSKQRYRQSLVRHLSDTLMLGHALGIEDPVQNIARLANIEQLICLHDNWSERNAVLQEEKRRPQFTDIPYKAWLTEENGISLITDYDDLCAEAKEQRHCASIYHNRISAGHYAIYRMYQPERMTIGISINKKKAFPFEIEQILGYKNVLPSQETRQIIYQWLEKNRMAYKTN